MKALKEIFDLKIDDNGITEYYMFENAVNESWDFITNGNYIYTNNGHVLEFNTETPSLHYISRLHNNFWASVLYDSYNDYVVYIYRNSNDEVNISRFKASNQEFVDEFIMNLGEFNIPRELISCGHDCYAARMFNGSSYRIYRFKKTDVMDINEDNIKATKLYPNPSSGDFYIESDKVLTEIKIFNSRARNRKFKSRND